MEEKKIHYRPFMHVIRESPITPLTKHSKKVLDAVVELQKMLQLYTAKKYEQADKLEKKISELEDEADEIKNYIRERLPKKIFMPIPRSDISRVLREQDAIADLAENVAHLLVAYKVSIPETIKKDLLKHNEIIVKAVETLQEAILDVSDLLKTSFRMKEREHILAHAHKVAEKEHKADLVKRKLKINIYKLEKKISLVAIYHLLRIVELQDYIANHAENVEDWLRGVVAR